LTALCPTPGLRSVSICRCTNPRSTGSRPTAGASGANSGLLVGFPNSAPTITSSTWRRIRMGIARIIRAESPIDPRCYIRVRRRSSWRCLVCIRTPGSYQGELRLSAGICGVISAQRSTEVYRCYARRKVRGEGPVLVGRNDLQSGIDVSPVVQIWWLTWKMYKRKSCVLAGWSPKPKNAKTPVLS
jgi:hypothetical protein